MIRRILAAAALAGLPTLAGMAAPDVAVGQTLAVVDSLSRTGDAPAAREALQRWWEEEREDAGRDDLQRALWLRGLLTLSPADARTDFRRLTVEFPGGPYTDRALLRLARYAHTLDRTVEAARHYRALALDHPGTPAALEAREWLERNEEAVAAAEAEEAARRPAPRADPPPADSVRTDTVGARPVAEAEEEAEGETVVPEEEVVPERPAVPEEPAAETGPYTVQLGAFSTEGRAMTLVERARDAGLEPRVVTVPGSDLVRVRVGRFDEAAGATRLYDRVRGLGFEATVSGDADREEVLR